MGLQLPLNQDSREFLTQVFIEKVERPRPRQFGRSFVITRRRVVVEAVLRTLINVHRIHFVVGLESCFIVRDARVDALIVSGVLQQQRRRNLWNVLCGCLAARTERRLSDQRPA